MAAPTETPPATTATEPEVAKDAKDAKDTTLTVDVAAAAPPAEPTVTEEAKKPARSSSVVPPFDASMRKLTPEEIQWYADRGCRVDEDGETLEPEGGLLACGIGPFHPNAHAVARDMKRRRMEAFADDSDEDKEAEDKEAEAKEAKKDQKDQKDQKDDDDALKEVSESVKRARKAAETLEEALHKDDHKPEGEAPKDKEEEAPKAEEEAMPPAVQRQMATLSPEAAVAPPTLRREATVAA